MVDRQLLLRKLAALDEYLAQLRELRDVSVDQYRADWRTQRAVDRTLPLAIETCAGVANHVIADRTPAHERKGSVRLSRTDPLAEPPNRMPQPQSR